MHDDTESILVIVCVLILLGAVVWFVKSSNANLDQLCKERFGGEWNGSSGYYERDACVNNNGDIKYPR